MAAEADLLRGQSITPLPALTGPPGQLARMPRAVDARRTLGEGTRPSACWRVRPWPRGFGTPCFGLGRMGAHGCGLDVCMRREPGWGAAQLNTLSTVPARSVALGTGTTLVRNAQSPYPSGPRYDGRVTHALGQPSCWVVRWVPGVYAHVTSPRSLLGCNEGGSPLHYTLLLGGVWCFGGTLTFGLFVFRYLKLNSYYILFIWPRACK